MNALVLIGGAVVLVALRFLKANTLVWMVAWWIVVFVWVRYGIDPPMPTSIINMFMAILTVALLTYVMADSERMAATKTPIVRFMVEPRYKIPLVIVVAIIPLLVAFKVYRGMSSEVAPPVQGRTIHPAPPASVSFNGKTIDLVSGHNPYRELEESDADAFAAHVDNGRRVYHQNCVFCHGDNMEGNGIFAHALDPIPANFADPNTIGMLQETYLFWRVAKGAPGLPNESTPWSSAMPAWEQFLTEEEIWDVILYLYDYTGLKPRAREQH